MQKETQFLDLGNQEETLSPESLVQNCISLLNFGESTISLVSDKSEQQLSMFQNYTFLVKVWGGVEVLELFKQIQCHCPP